MCDAAADGVMVGRITGAHAERLTAMTTSQTRAPGNVLYEAIGHLKERTE